MEEDESLFLIEDLTDIEQTSKRPLTFNDLIRTKYSIFGVLSQCMTALSIGFGVAQQNNIMLEVYGWDISKSLLLNSLTALALIVITPVPGLLIKHGLMGRRA